MNLLISAFLLALIYDIASVGSLKTNYIRHHLGSRTPYRFRSNKNESRIKYPNCKDTKIWMVTRHGTRLPSRKDIHAAPQLVELKYEVLLQHEHGKGQLTNEQLNNLKDWRTDLDADEESYLTLEGRDEMILLAERMQKRFPNAIKQRYSNKTFLFRYTATQRAQQSARYFTNGLFEKKESQDIIFAPATRVDPVLRFYKHCDRWLTQVKRNPETYKETKLFSHSREMNQTLESISHRLGLNRVLEFDTVNLMYKYCGYETSWDKHHISPWCYGFDEKSIQVFEYYHDLKAYWLDGYGHELTYRQACMLMKNMFEFFGKERGYRSVFLFSHSGAVLKILTHLKLFRPPSPLKGDHIVEDREWKLSEIDCFAANLAFVLYKTMPRIYKKKLGTRDYRNYSEATVNEALSQVVDGKLSIRGASEQYNVPCGTIYNRYKGMHMRKPGAQTVFSESEEKAILKSAAKCADWGYPTVNCY